MTGRTNTGGDSKLFAAIGVTYPAGSTCTCTNGSKILHAKNTSGQWVFSIPESGTWTVSCTDGTESASKIVEITTEGQSVNVELSYWTCLYEEGNQYTDITGGWTASKYESAYGKMAAVTYNSDSVKVKTDGSTSEIAFVHTKNKVNLSSSSTLRCKVNVIAPFYSIALMVEDATSGYTPVVEANEFELGSGERTIEADVSNCSGTYYIGVSFKNTSAQKRVAEADLLEVAYI